MPSRAITIKRLKSTFNACLLLVIFIYHYYYRLIYVSNSMRYDEVLLTIPDWAQWLVANVIIMTVIQCLLRRSIVLLRKDWPMGRMDITYCPAALAQHSWTGERRHLWFNDLDRSTSRGTNVYMNYETMNEIANSNVRWKTRKLVYTVSHRTKELKQRAEQKRKTVAFAKKVNPRCLYGEMNNT